MKTYEEKMEQAVRKADAEIGVYTTNRQEAKIIKAAIRNTFDISKCTKKILDDFGTMRMKLASQMAQEDSATDAAIEAINQSQQKKTCRGNGTLSRALRECKEMLQPTCAY